MKLAIALVISLGFLTAITLAADLGPAADVAAVRAAAHAKYPASHTYGVHVVGNYALTDWDEGDASGYAAFKRVSAEQWKQIDWGGGATDVSDLVQHGVPEPIARQLCSGWGDASPC